MCVIIFKGKNTIQHYAFPKFHALYNLSKVLYTLFLVTQTMFFTIIGVRVFLEGERMGYSPKIKVRVIVLIIFPPLLSLNYVSSAKN